MSIRQDVVYAGRLFRRQPGIVGMTIAGLALAIGISTAAFTVANVTVSPRHGIANPDRVATLNTANSQAGAVGDRPWSHPDYLQLREAVTTADVTACFWGTTGRSFRIDRAAEEERTLAGQVAVVSGNYFSVLGGRASIGRTLSAADDLPGAPNSVVLRHAFWKNRLGADDSVVGRTIWIDDAPTTIMGVAEEGFRGVCEGAMGWTSLPHLFETTKALQLKELKPGEAAGPLFDLVRVIARLRPNITAERAQANIDSIATQLIAQEGHVGSQGRPPFQLNPIDALRPEAKARVAAMGILIALLLVLACANVTNLLLASATGRTSEIGTRLALGAGRARVARMLLTESVLLGALSAVAGLGIALWTTPTLAQLMGQSAGLDTSPNALVYGFMVVVAFIASIAAGVAPALRSSRLDLTSSLKSDALGAPTGVAGSRLRSALIAVQAVVAIVLLIVAGMATRTVLRASGVELGADVPRLVNVTMYFKRSDDDSARRSYLDAAKNRLREIPGIEHSTRVLFPLFGHGGAGGGLASGGTVDRNATDADYFETAGIRIVRGRTFSAEEVATSARVAVISETLAQKYWSAADPIGDSLERLWGRDDGEGATLESWHSKPAGTRIIGVVAETTTALIQRRPVIYLPIPPGTSARESLVVRVAADNDPMSLMSAIRGALRSLDATVSVTAESADANRRIQLEYPVSQATLGLLLGVTALVLALIGLFGVTAFAVAQRRQEMGIRVALGASGGRILRMLVGDGLRPVVIGLIAGIAVSQPLIGVLERFIGGAGRFFGITSHDPYAIGLSIVVLLFAAVVAAAVPARDAMRIDPAQVLKRDSGGR